MVTTDEATWTRSSTSARRPLPTGDPDATSPPWRGAAARTAARTSDAMARTPWLTTTAEATTGQRWVARRREEGGRRPLTTRRLVPVEMRPPYPGARDDRVSVRVQWMTDTPRAILVYVVAEDVQAWVPRWCWPAGSLVEAAGEAGDVALPRYLVRQLRGEAGGGVAYGLRWARACGPAGRAVVESPGEPPATPTPA